MSATGLLRWLIFLAMLFAPLAMIGGSPAAAHAQSAAEGHCAETGEPLQTPPSGHAPSSDPADCMTACAGCLPAQPGTLAAHARLEPAARTAPVAFLLHGLQPEAAIPPPRRS